MQGPCHLVQLCALISLAHSTASYHTKFEQFTKGHPWEGAVKDYALQNAFQFRYVRFRRRGKWLFTTNGSSNGIFRRPWNRNSCTQISSARVNRILADNLSPTIITGSRLGSGRKPATSVRSKEIYIIANETFSSLHYQFISSVFHFRKVFIARP